LRIRFTVASEKKRNIKVNLIKKIFLIAGDPPGMEQQETEVNRERIRSLMDDEADRMRHGFSLGATVGSGPPPLHPRFFNGFNNYTF
jgi:hypothetical protein